MTPFIDDPDFTLHVGDALETLQAMPAESVHCCVTSPPYWGLRDYGTGAWEGGDADCDHLGPPRMSDKTGLSHPELKPRDQILAEPSRLVPSPFRDVCGKCGATRVDQQLGLEPTPDQYITRMVAVFREVRRVLRADGTLWLNIGDSYAGGGTLGRNDSDRIGASVGSLEPRTPPGSKYANDAINGENRSRQAVSGLKPKDLVGIPWRLAFALQADGWCLRSDVIWSKPNPMPESVTDRPTKAHEYLFLLTPCTWSGGIEPWPMTREDAIWLAAIVDGEGTICFQEQARKEWAATISCRLSVVNTNRALLERVSAITNIAENTTPSPRPRNDGAEGRPIFTWQVTNEKAARIIAAIRPHLVAKQAQAELAIYVHTLNQKHKGRGGHTTTDADLALKRRAAAACSDLNHGREADLGWFKPVRPGRWVTPNSTFYDADAIREPQDLNSPFWRTHPNGQRAVSRTDRLNGSNEAAPNTWLTDLQPNSGRNKRSVWEIATEAYPDAHFATFPQALVEPCIKAGTSEHGCCPVCGAPWVRETETTYEPSKGGGKRGRVSDAHDPRGHHNEGVGERATRIDKTTGWFPSCWPSCDFWVRDPHERNPRERLEETVPGVVLDPFLGSGTTAQVARRLGRRSIGIELNPEYAKLAARRLQQQTLFACVVDESAGLKEQA